MSDSKEKKNSVDPTIPVEEAFKILAAAIIESKIFDEEFYLAQLPDDERRQITDPVRHYIQKGDVRNISPHPLFSPALYRLYNMQALEMRQPSLAHYLAGRWKGSGITSMMFESRWYLEANPDAATSGLAPLSHYLQFGIPRGIAPVRFINPAILRRGSAVDTWREDPAYTFVLARHKGPPIPESQQDSTSVVVEPTYSNVLSDSLRKHLGTVLTRAHDEMTERELSASLETIQRVARECPTFRGAADDAPVVSIVIPVHNQLRFTLECLESVFSVGAKDSFEIIVVDDSSFDRTALVLNQVERLRVIHRKSNGGFIAACNDGASEARGEYLAFLNNDTVVLSGWLDELLSVARESPNVAVVGSQMVDASGALQEAGGIVWGDGTAENYGRGQNPARSEFSYKRSVDFCSGAAVLIPRSRFFELGGFDASYAPAYCEDVDLAFTARSRGYDVVYQPFSKVVHFEGISSGRDTQTGVKAYQVTNLSKLKEKWHEKLARHGAPRVDPEIERDRGTRGHILFVDACFPTPDRDAGSMVADGWIRNLVTLGYHVTFVGIDQFVRISKWTERLERLGVYCPVIPHEPSLKEFLLRYAPKCAAVVAIRYQCAAAIYEILRITGASVPSIFMPSDLHYLREARLAELENSSERKLKSLVIQGRELDVVRQSTLTCVHSSHEREILGAMLPESKVEVAPLITPVPGRSRGFSEREGICFIGGFQHLANVDAVIFFAREVWPRVQESLPEATFFIVGPNATPEVQALSSDSIRVLGHVEDLTPILDSIKLTVAPIRYGAGVKGKVVLSMGAGVPVVGTPLAFEGMDLDLGTEVLSGQTAEEFATQVSRIYRDASLWESVSDAAVTRARREYTLESNLPRVEAFLRKIGVS